MTISPKEFDRRDRITRGLDDPDRTKHCDGCDSYWEPSFICDHCSGLQPDPTWEITDPATNGTEPPTVLLTICKNCCNCQQ